MKYKRILARLAPCGLDCSKCFAFSGRKIKSLSSDLKTALGAFDKYAIRFSEYLPVFKNYQSFGILISYFAQADCGGCRTGGCKYPNCEVMACTARRGVDFCFQCDEFPCERPPFDPDLKQRWLQMNSRMREVGIHGYFQETRDSPRYK